MPTFTNALPSFVKRNPGATVLATVALAAGVAFALRGGNASTNYVDRKTESVICTATGGQANYPLCNWHEPVNDAGSGSTVTGLYLTVGHDPVAIGIDGTVGPSATVSGSTAITNFTNAQLSSGATVLNLTGAYLVNSGSYVRIVSLKNPGAGFTANMFIDYTTRLSR